MKKILTLIIFTTVLMGCKKEDQGNKLELTGTSWENSWLNTENVLWFARLDFNSGNQVVFYNSFTKDKLMSSAGRATLSYTLEDLGSESPKIHITGKYNNIAGETGKGAVVDFTLKYVPSSRGNEAMLTAENIGSYIKIVYK